jgi:hypothetical protein
MRNEQEKFKNKGTHFSINSTGTLNASGNHHTKAVDFTYYVLENFRETRAFIKWLCIGTKNYY